MKNFTAIYQMPVAALEEWMAKPESERKEEEDKVRGDWDAWLAAHKDSVLNTIALGKTKRVGANSIEDAKNGFMLSSYVAAESLEAAAEIFKDHPHLQLTGATIDVMEAMPMSGM
jgi:hypothetical protein